jgi:arylformamidase
VYLLIQLYYNSHWWELSLHFCALSTAKGMKLNMNVHTATHLDVPFHFDPQGKTIEQMPIGRFQGDAIPIDLFGIAPDSAISAEHLAPYKDKIRSGDIVLLCTGWSKKRGYTREYYNQWPYLSGEGVEWLVEKGVKGVGIAD